MSNGGLVRYRYFVLPRLRRGGRLDGETVTHVQQLMAVKTARENNHACHS